MGRGGASNDRSDGAERKCIATGEVQPKHGLIRFVVGPDNQVYPDILGKLPGRGIYVAADRAALELAIKKKAFSRSAKQPVTLPDGLVDEVEQQLARRVVELISLQRKAGKAVAGYEKVKGWLQTEEAEVLIQAVDGSGRGKSKLSTPHYGHYIGWLTADELGLAFGRQTVIHGALASGGLTQRVVEEAGRLKGVRVNEGGNGHPKG
ncbi:RNA-binding protein [Sulfitobacter sp. KE34]|uniref:RNA-binding protein n=1 Tax=Sulfitobacter faviae TaxID=1775881 RepID=A0AAX3LQE8_9RHOB|nr:MULTISPECIES: RNA-binding protein [Sulfitobacter]MDF3349847.1 RNA-binding protein [Sulfitobacter sp. KE12]MDF3353519.1 RNA-binding protein [Sulfitobacter sp. KE27]MDF3357166.1 RNA-binding protein [Sulfitobacter sp. KE33]MDF3361527.1 RNA-binding protein [Sulfitobacter sp. Ks41]MDF3364590.1 RNA-binding protein [Sulfitobacter sp. Ks34]